MIKIVVILMGLILIAGCDGTMKVFNGQASTGGNNKELLMECMFYDSYSPDGKGLGKICKNTEECQTHMKQLDPSFVPDKQQIKCVTTEYKKIQVGGVFLSCNKVDDCSTQLGVNIVPGMTKEDVDILTTYKSLIRCTNNFCETTIGMDNVFNSKGMMKIFGADGNEITPEQKKLN